jgi:16S rRNA (guanine1207-N2)-methyltransferase
MSHYYVNDENLSHKEIDFNYTFRNNIINFKSDLGVFSKDRVDFGTNVLINALPAFTNEMILDVGCGVGVIGLSIAKGYTKSHVDLLDVNSRAVELAKVNAANNNIRNAKVLESNLYENIYDKYDYIITNPPIRAGKSIIYKIVHEAIEHLNSNGKLILVINKKHGAPSMEREMLSVFGNCTTIEKNKGFFVFSSTKEG